MDIFVQQLINGLVLGSIYALVALGYTMVYGILELINFAHGEVTMVGAMVCLAIIGWLLGLGLVLPWPVILMIGLGAAVVVCMALGFSIERIAYRPLRRAPRLAALITAIGVSIVLQNVAMLIWGKQYVSFPALVPVVRYEIAGATITALQIVIVLLSGALMAGLWLLVKRTGLGRAMRATASRRFSSEFAYESPRCPSPPAPNAVPASTATPPPSSRRSATVPASPRRSPVTFVKAETAPAGTLMTAPQRRAAANNGTKTALAASQAAWRRACMAGP